MATTTLGSSVARVGNNFPNGAFIPIIWSTKLNYKFYKATYFKEIFNADWQSAIGGIGSKVMIRIRPTVAVGKYKTNQPIAYQDMTDEFIELVIDQTEYFAFKLDDIDKAQQDIAVTGEVQFDADKQMKIAQETQIYSTIYADAGNAISQTALDKTNVIDWFVDAGVLLDEKNVPQENRWAIIPPKVRGLISKSDLKNAAIMGDGPSILRKKADYVGNINGFEVLQSNCLAKVGNVHRCMFGQKSAVTWASQIDKVENLRLQDSFGDAVRGLYVYGYKVNQPDALVDAPCTVG
jgi:hypothetical protein